MHVSARIKPMRAGEWPSTAIIQTDVTGRQPSTTEAPATSSPVCGSAKTRFYSWHTSPGGHRDHRWHSLGSTVPAALSCLGEVGPAFRGEDELASTIGEESFAARWGRTRFELGERARPLEAARSDWHLLQLGR